MVGRFLLYLLGALFLLLSCVEKKRDEILLDIESGEYDESVLNILGDEKTVCSDREDSSIEDFLFNFFRDTIFQNDRIKPDVKILYQSGYSSFTVDSSDLKTILSSDGFSTYAMMFNTLDSLQLKSDSGRTNVVVDWLDIKTDSVKQYTFEKEDGRWWLAKVVHTNVFNHRDRSFYRFYNLFCRDTVYQQQHVLNPFSFQTHDDYSEELIAGSVNAESWPEYAPELPLEHVFFINYCESKMSSKINNKRRVIVLFDVAAGMSAVLSFKRVQDSWWLTGLEFD